MSYIQKLKGLFAVVLMALLSLFAGAQESGGADIDVNINKGGEWYQQTWVWIVGGALFILLLVAILRGGSRRTE
jgi:hypothetical protein